MTAEAASLRPVLLGLGAAAVWGASDFSGGLATRRARPAIVVVLAHCVSLVLLIGLDLRLHGTGHVAPLDPLRFAAALLSGVTGGAGLMCLYSALASGLMGLSAAVAGLLTVILPVALTVASDGWPDAPKLGGFVTAAAAILLISSGPTASADPAPDTPISPPAHPGRRALMLAVLAGIGFGLQLVLLHGSIAGSSPGGDPGALLLALTVSRIGGALIALAVLLRSRNRSRAPNVNTGATTAQASPTGLETRDAWLPLALLAGLLDTGGNLLYMLSSVTGRLDVAAVLSSLYPAGTILLAAALLKERTTRLQTAGMALALIAVVLIAR